MQNTSSKGWTADHSSKAGMTGRETAFLLSCSCLFLIHAMYTLISGVLLPGLPFHTAYHAALALVWLILGNCCIRAAKRGHAPLMWLRPVIIFAMVLYLYGIYSNMMLYLGTKLFPIAYMKSLIWSCMMSFAFSTLLLVLEVQQVCIACRTLSVSVRCRHPMPVSSGAIKYPASSSYAVLYAFLHALC